MAVPALFRAADGYMYSDVCKEWGRWQQSYTKSHNKMLGGQEHIETIPGRSHSGSARFRFDPDKPNSDLVRQNALLEDAYNDVLMKFRDFQGRVFFVEVLAKPDLSPVTQAGYTKEVNDVTVELLRGAETTL